MNKVMRAAANAGAMGSAFRRTTAVVVALLGMGLVGGCVRGGG